MLSLELYLPLSSAFNSLVLDLSILTSDNPDFEDPLEIIDDIAKSFDKGLGFCLGLFFLRPVFYIILAFSDNEYIGPNGNRVYVA